MASSLSISRASSVMGSILERSIDIPRDISFRGNLTLVDRSGAGEAVLKQDNLIKLVDITDGEVISNKVIIVDSNKNINGVNSQTNTGQFIFDKTRDDEEGTIDLVFKRARGSVTNKIETVHRNHIGVLSFQPYVGTAYIDSAGIDVNTYKKSYSSQYSGSEIIFSNSGGSDINSGKHDSLKIDGMGNLNILKSRELRLNVFRDTNYSGFRPSISTAAPGYTMELPAVAGTQNSILKITKIGYGGQVKLRSNNTGNLIDTRVFNNLGVLTSAGAHPLIITNSGSDYEQTYFPEINTDVNMTGGTLKENGTCSASNIFSITSSSVTASNPVKLTINPSAIEEGAKITVNTMNGNMGEEILTDNTFFIKITAGTVGSSVTELELYTNELLTNGVDTTGKTSTGNGTHTITEQNRIYLSSISIPTDDYYNGWTIETINPNSKRIIYEYDGGSKEVTLSSGISLETNTLTQYKLTQGHGSVEITRTIVNNINIYTLSNYKPPPAPNEQTLSNEDNYYNGWTLVTDVSGTFYTGDITSYNSTSKEIIINWKNEPGTTIDVIGAKSSLTNHKIIPASIKITSINNNGQITGAQLMDGGSGYIPNIEITMNISSQTKLGWSALTASDASVNAGQLSTGPGLTGGGSMTGDITINLDLSTHGNTESYVSLPDDKILLQSNSNNSSRMPKISTFLTSIAGTGLTSDNSTGTLLINNSQSIITNISDHFRIYSSLNGHSTHYLNIGKDDSDNIRIKGEYDSSNHLHKTIIQTQSTNTNNDSSIQFDIGNKSQVINIDNDGLSVKKGFIESINILNGGSDYSSGDTVVITASPFGTTYTAEAEITVATVDSIVGVITSIKIIKSGLGYSSTTPPIITVVSSGGQNVSLSPQVNDVRYILGEMNNFNARYDGYFKDLYISGDQNFQGTLKVTGQGAVELGKPSNLDFSEDDSNFLFGYEVGRNGGIRNTTSKNTTFIGYKTGFDSTASSEFNTFCGSNTGYKNTSGTRNTYFGYQSGYTGTTTTESVSIGNLSGAFLTGSYNTSVGANSGYGSSNGTNGHSGNNNVYLGYKTESRGGNNNLFAGSNAGELSTSSDGVFLGYQSGKNSTGNGNVLIGYQSGYTSTTSLYNVLIGYQSGYNISANNTSISGNYTGNITVGYKSGYNLAGDSSRNIIIGPNTGPPDDSGTNTHHNKLYISTRGESVTPLILGDQDTINSQTLNFNADVTISGTNSDGTLTVEGGKIVFWGQHYTDGNGSDYKKKWKIESPGTTITTAKDTNIQIVDEASGLPRSTAAYYNTLMGVQITTSNAISDSNNINDTPALTGSRNSIFGAKALYNGTSCQENTMIGYQSGYHNISGGMNTFIGSYSGRNITGYYNTSVGRYSGFASSNSGSYRLIIDTSGSSKGDDSLIYGNQTSSIAQTLSLNAAVTISKKNSSGTIDVEGSIVNIHGPTAAANGKIWALRIQNGGQYADYKDTNLSLTNHTNIFNESEAASNNTYSNILIGKDVGKNDGTTNGRWNVFIGHQVAQNEEYLGENNVAIGNNSQRDIGEGADGTTVLAGVDNTSCGYASLLLNKTGNYNSAFGSKSGYYINSGQSNSVFGYQAGYNITTGDNNICIGRGAGPTTTDAGLDKCLYIDAGSIVTTGTGTNSLIYGNQGSSTHTLRLNADVTIVDGANSSGNLNVGGSLTTGSLTSSITATSLTIQDINIDVNPSVGRTSFDYNLFFTNNSHNVDFTGLQLNTFFGTYGAHLEITNGASGNSAFGYHNLVDLTHGDMNTSIGTANNTFLSTGSYNVALGSNNLRLPTASNYCIGIGTQNFYLAGNGSDNIGIGRWNCYNVSGDENVGIGNECLKGTSSDGSLYYCVGIGSCAGKESVGNYNHFIGKNAGYFTSGSYNIGMGDDSLRYLRTGSYNIGIGHEACRGLSIGSSGRTFAFNIGLGRNALTSLSTGTFNLGLGDHAGYSITNGYHNVCLGYISGYVTSSGYNNVFLGTQSGRYNTSGFSNISIGPFSGRQTTGSRNISIGNDAGPTSSEVTLSDRLYIDKSRLGSGSLIYGNMNSRTVAINGSLSITGSLSTSGSFGSIIADTTGSVSVPSNKTFTIPSINQVTISGSNTNMYLGYQSAFSGVRTGNPLGNTFFGYQSGNKSNSSADYNTYIGFQAGYAGTSSELSTAIGTKTLYTCSTGIRNTCLGFFTGYYVTGSYNTCLGYNAGPTGPSSSSYNLYIDPTMRKGSDSLIYGYGHPTSTSRYVRVNGSFQVKQGYNAFASNWYNWSDISLKKDIFKIDEYINDKIDLLEPVLYTLKSNDKKDVGFIAQEVKKVFPLLVSKDNNGLLTIDYSKLTSYLVKGAQENNNKIKELESKLDEEKDKRESMEKFFKEEIEKLRKEILRN